MIAAIFETAGKYEGLAYIINAASQGKAEWQDFALAGALYYLGTLFSKIDYNSGVIVKNQRVLGKKIEGLEKLIKEKSTK